MPRSTATARDGGRYAAKDGCGRQCQEQIVETMSGTNCRDNVRNRLSRATQEQLPRCARAAIEQGGSGAVKHRDVRERPLNREVQVP